MAYSYSVKSSSVLGTSPHQFSSAVLAAGAGIVDVAHDRLVEDLAVNRLHAHRADQDEPANRRRRHRRHLRGDPAAEAQADQGYIRHADRREKKLIRHRDVTDVAHPGRTL